jgi:pimeloyl-ACP methyl ester carboxylesterase
MKTMESLHSKYRVYALDLFGFGDSSRNTTRYTLEHQIALLDDFMRELGIPKAALFGHGFGALVAMEFARRYGDRIPRLLLVNAPLYNPGNLEHRVPAARRVTPLTGSRPAAPAPLPPPPNNLEALNAPTIQSMSAAMRAAMAELARDRATSQAKTQTSEMMRALPGDLGSDANNPLIRLIAENSLDTLLARCFKRGDSNFDKLYVDVARTDRSAVVGSAQVFDAGTVLDTLRLLPMPTVVVHGADDPIYPLPSDEVWHYITFDKEQLLMPVILPNVRHFPMLEDDRFLRLANDFLDAPDISKLEIKERFRRRTR